MTRLADGAWGLRFPALGASPQIFASPEPDWFTVDLEVDIRAPSDEPLGWSSDSARFVLLGGGVIHIRRSPPEVRLGLPVATAPECVLQPHLSAAASTFALWAERQAMHAGAFLHEGGAWLLLGAKDRGKSSTLGWMAGQGMSVLADDLVIVDREAVFAGPRCLDLRSDAADRMRVGRNLGFVGTRERWRLDLPSCPAVSPLRGSVLLDWGPKLQIERVPPSERIGRLVEHRALALPWVDGVGLLDLAARPTVSWVRPREWQASKSSAEALLNYLGDL